MSRRAETGPMQFEDDWTGVFIRGDNAAYYAMLLSRTLSKEPRTMFNAPLWDLLQVLGNSNEMNQQRPQPQKMRSFEECVKEPDDGREQGEETT